MNFLNNFHNFSAERSCSHFLSCPLVFSHREKKHILSSCTFSQWLENQNSLQKKRTVVVVCTVSEAQWPIYVLLYASMCTTASEYTNIKVCRNAAASTTDIPSSLCYYSKLSAKFDSNMCSLTTFFLSQFEVD